MTRCTSHDTVCDERLVGIDRKFTELRSEMEYLARAVDDAHEEFWGWVQEIIKKLRKPTN